MTAKRGTADGLQLIGKPQPWNTQRRAWRQRGILLKVDIANLRDASLLQANSSWEAHEMLRLSLTRWVRIPRLDVTNLAPASSSPQNGKRLFRSRFHDRERLGLDPYRQWSGFGLGRCKLVLMQSRAWCVLPSAAKNVPIAAAESWEAVTPLNRSPEAGIAERVKPAGAGLICSSDADAHAKILIKVLQMFNHAYQVPALNLATFDYSSTNFAAEIGAVFGRFINNHNSRAAPVGKLNMSGFPSQTNLGVASLIP